MKTAALLAMLLVAMAIALPVEDDWRAEDEGLDTVVEEDIPYCKECDELERSQRELRERNPEDYETIAAHKLGYLKHGAFRKTEWKYLNRGGARSVSIPHNMHPEDADADETSDEDVDAMHDDRQAQRNLRKAGDTLSVRKLRDADMDAKLARKTAKQSRKRTQKAIRAMRQVENGDQTDKKLIRIAKDAIYREDSPDPCPRAILKRAEKIETANDPIEADRWLKVKAKDRRMVARKALKTLKEAQRIVDTTTTIDRTNRKKLQSAQAKASFNAAERKLVRQEDEETAQTQKKLFKQLDRANRIQRKDFREMRARKLARKLTREQDAVAPTAGIAGMLGKVEQNVEANDAEVAEESHDSLNNANKTYLQDPIIKKGTEEDSLKNQGAATALHHVLENDLSGSGKWNGPEQYNHDPYNDDAGGIPHTNGDDGANEADDDNGYGRSSDVAWRRVKDREEEDVHNGLGQPLVDHSRTNRFPWIGYHRSDTPKALAKAKFRAECKLWRMQKESNALLLRIMRKPVRFKPFHCSLKGSGDHHRLRRVARALRKYPHVQVQMEAQTSYQAAGSSKCMACHGCVNRKRKSIDAKQLANCRAETIQWHLWTHGALNNMTKVAKPCMFRAFGSIYGAQSVQPEGCDLHPKRHLKKVTRKGSGSGSSSGYDTHFSYKNTQDPNGFLRAAAGPIGHLVHH